MSTPLVNVLYAPGTNSHKETIYAFERVGARAQLLMLSDVLGGERRLDEGDALCIPGGFSYGDHMGAGTLAGRFLQLKLSDQLASAARKPIIAICNGFQTAVRAGLFGEGVALTVNEAGTFRNIIRQPHIVEDSSCVWLQGMAGQTLRFPCAHGEGRFVFRDKVGWEAALRYPDGQNPDGSADDIAGITSPDGLVLGLMDHPERLLDEPGTLDIFANGVKAAAG
jgi:phosphoribosylformylglycinamidine (FGAM) synthase-like amidotransferase family enzyme